MPDHVVLLSNLNQFLQPKLRKQQVTPDAASLSYLPTVSGF